jgi:predicted DNA-binding transcriptional regulator YafY
MSNESRARRARHLVIVLLLRARGQLRAPVLAKALGVSARTIARDCIELELLGIPVLATRGARGGIKLDAESRVDLVTFAATEPAPQRGVVAAQPVGAAEAVSRSLEHLRLSVRAILERLDTPWRRDAEAGLAALELSSAGPASPIDAEVLRIVRTALWLGRRVHLAYLTRGRLRERDVDPLVLVARDGVWYLSGYCHWRRDVRTFVVSRITHVRPLNTPAPVAQQVALVGDRGVVHHLSMY